MARNENKMKITNNNDDRAFENCPPGATPAVLADVVDLGMVETEFQGQKKIQHKCRLVFLTAKKMTDGRPFYVSQQFTASLYEKGNLARFLAQWLNRPLTKAEQKEFDLETLIGAQAQLNIVHTVSEKNGKTYANIFSIAPLPKFDPETGLPFQRVEIPSDFKRKAPVATTGNDDFLAGLQEPAAKSASNPVQRADVASEADLNDDLPF